MKRIHFIRIAGTAFLLLLTLLLPAASGAFAEGEQAEEQAVAVPIIAKTELLSDAGKPLGTLFPDEEGGVSFTLKSGETFAGVVVSYLPSAEQDAGNSKALAGKTKVFLSLRAEASSVDLITPAPDATPTPAPKKTPAELPAEGWIDANIVLFAVNAQREQDEGALAIALAELESLKSATPVSTAPTESTPTPEQKPAGGLSLGGAGGWMPIAAVVLGTIGAGMLAWIAFSAFAAASEAKHQTDQLKKLGEELNKGITVKSPVRVEQAAWPQHGTVPIVSESLDRLAAQPTSVVADSPKREEAPPPPPKLIPPGEDPELLALCNSLAGVASAEKWHNTVKDAGWRAVLLQTNPTEKGTYIPDESGYSIVACLMRGADADIAFVLPSYQDPNASEERWSEFYELSTDMGVKNFRIDALPEMFIERGTFFLQKSKGRLTRRPQSY